eukprot:TRINITY_DN388_c0_g1_i3.p1 TRINITY_DN388_c0_g1~~TRINITY_DN388_c0_g1_i3.p1  ORF type:complete len:222 (+),score=49.95 TRINITY_DN388_c0_g1_i3:83-748(+)
MARGLSATTLLVLVAFGLSSIAFVGPVVQQPGNQSLRASRARTASQETIALNDAEEAASPWRLGGAALSMLAAIALALLPMEEAQAAKSGGRIGGSAPAARRAPPPRPAAPRAATTTNNTTVINRTTVVAPPVVAAPAMGYGYGGFGMVVAPPPTLGDVVVGTVVGGAINNAMYGGMNRGPSTTDRMLDNQQRQDERQMDRQASEIDQLKMQISQLAAEKK